MFSSLKEIWKPAACCLAISGCSMPDNVSDDLSTMNMSFAAANDSSLNHNLPISFNLPNNWDDLQYPLLKDGAGVLPQDKQAGVLAVINNLASTFEGREYLMKAAEHSPGGALHFVYNPNGQTFTLQGITFMGNLDANAKYLTTNGERLPLSLDRVVLHEVLHNAFDHLSSEGSAAVARKYGLSAGSDFETEVTRIREEEAMAATNEYLSKYCGSIPRYGYDIIVQKEQTWFGRELGCNYN